MITIRVDGQTLNVPEGISIIEAARLSGVDIPALGYDPRVSPPSGAELSTVELVEGERSRFISATGTTVAEGMEIRTKSPA
ncbi:MAG TPA: 2Fe-2S iron-sulfur cluster-binding protein, partial [Acidobacteriota bacterium]|nr:2Fe-2S iron-sulfur cluster-binding protein [Acidobacteriota bacterium]